MSSTVYALLVGIDQYQQPVPPLSGCVADINAMQAFLEGRIPTENLRIETLRNEQATYATVTNTFLNHLGKAGKDDVALFYYSGHGSQAPTAEAFWHFEPDRLDETLVCYDSRVSGHFDLADKEMSKLIAEVANKDPHVVVILDSCHSGSATRDIESVGVRRAPTDDRPRPLSTYLVTPSEFALIGSTRGGRDVKSDWLSLPRGRHVLISACQSDEEAKELAFGGTAHGVFSYFLLEALQGTTTSWTYRDLFARVNALVRTRVSRQSPAIEASDFKDLDRPFLGGAVRPHPPYFTVRNEKNLGWTLDGGLIHGIPQPQGTETTHLAVFRQNATNFEDGKSVIGTATVTKAEPTRAIVSLTFEEGIQPDPALTYKAVVTGQALSALGIELAGDKAELDSLRAALNDAGPTGGPSLLVRESHTGAELKVVAEHRSYRIFRTGDDRPFHAAIDDGDVASRPARAVAYLEHMARWIRMARLTNPSSRLAPDAVRMEVFLVDDQGKSTQIDPAGSGEDLRLNYEYRNGEWQEPQIKVRLTNTTKRRLYCMLFDLTDRFKVTAALIPGGGVWLDPAPKNEAWAFDGAPIPASVPDELWQQGMIEYKDLLKLVVSTEECNATLFEQDDIEVRYDSSRGTRGGDALNTLERLMQRVHTRDLAQAGAKDRLPDWISREISVTTVRPLEGARLAGPGKSVSLAPSITVAGHSQLRAHVRLTTAPDATRAAGMRALPSWVRDDPAAVQPFQLSPSRGVEAGLNVLEFSDVTAHEAVTPEKPLVIHVDAALGPDERIFPFAYDPESECYIPVGRGVKSTGGVDIHLEQLPPPAADTRSLTGSIKIYFQKVLSEKLGVGYSYPLLRRLDADCNYNADVTQVRGAVASAKRILLYVHGIIGDTSVMAASGYRPKPVRQPALKAVGKLYDVVLTFDYENLNTPIEANARSLKQRLEAVGLGAGHNKTLDIVAHSMGGLVSRWFIEREGGNAIVQRLVMLGTPNAGSPWPTIQDFAGAAISLGLNALTTVVWPATVLGGLVSAVEKIDVALDQMQPGSDFLKSLAASPDPGIPYTVLAGNTSIIAAALAPEAGNKSRVERLFASLRLRPAVYKAISLAFYNRPNDIAVSVESIGNLPADRTQAIAVREVASDHMSYFTTEAGLGALAEALHVGVSAQR